MKAMSFQDDIPSILNDNFEDHDVILFVLTSMQNANENCHYPELVGEPLTLELNFTFPLEHATELIVLGERMSSVAVDKFGVVGKTFKMDNAFLQQLINCIPLLKYPYGGPFSSDYVPTFDNDIFANTNTQPSNMPGDHWITIASSRQKMYFADSLGRKKYKFLKQHDEQMMPEPVKPHPSVCGFYTIYAAFNLFNFRQEENTRVHDVNVLSFISNYM